MGRGQDKPGFAFYARSARRPGPRQSPAPGLSRPWLGDAARLFNRVFASPFVKIAIAALVLAAAIWLIRTELRAVKLSAIVVALRATPAWAVALAAIFTAGSYACLATVEWSVWRLIGRPQPPVQTAQRSFFANSLSSLVGFGPASGTALRLRVYASAKLSPAEIAELVFLYTAATYVAGVVTMGVCVLAAIRPLSAALSAPWWAIGLGGAMLIAPASLWFLLFRRGRRGGAAPGKVSRLLALGAGLGDWVFSGIALFVLTSGDPGALPSFLAIFCLGSLLGGLAGVPGGIGVLEATVLGLHVGSLGHTTAAALILYRAIYLLGPASITLIALAARRLIGVRGD